MYSYSDLKEFFADQNLKLIIAADAETRVSQYKKGKRIFTMPTGGVAVALDPIAKASNAVYIARAKTHDEEKSIRIEEPDGAYSLQRLFFSDKETDLYYNGFANQTLWPLCHVAFQRPEFRLDWFEGFKKVNERFANATKEQIRKTKAKKFVWINDYQLCLVPKYLGKQKDTVTAFFWHIPWPTWEAFRILPFKREILESLLSVDFLAFHRGYHVRNFLDTLDRELEVRIDEERGAVVWNNHTLFVRNLPMGVDTEVIATLATAEKPTFLTKFAQKLVGTTRKGTQFDALFRRYKVILGVDRLDYTKGLLIRLNAIDHFLEKHRNYRGKIVYLGILASSRSTIPSYRQLRKDVVAMAAEINKKYATGSWKPIHIVIKVLDRRDIIHLYQKASVCLVTPRDDGMNLVSKEFVVAASHTDNPGTLVLSIFAGSAIDLTDALIVNPYDIEEVAENIKKGLEMKKAEKVKRMIAMRRALDERNVYDWARRFIEEALEAAR